MTARSTGALAAPVALVLLVLLQAVAGAAPTDAAGALAPPAATPVQGMAGAAACAIPTGEPAFDPDAQVRTWDGAVDPGATGGRISVQSYKSGAWIVPWNRSAWRVDVGEVDPEDALEVTVDATASGGAFSLTVAITAREGPGGVPVGVTAQAEPHAQVKVRVPRLTYQHVFATDEPTTTGAGPVNLGGASSSAPEWNAVRVHHLNATDVRVTVDNRDAHVTNATADALRLQSDNGALGAANVTADNLHVETDNGHACATDARARGIRGVVDNGALRLHDVHGEALRIAVNNGDVAVARSTLRLLETTTDNGNITLNDVRATTVRVVGDNHDLDARALRVQDLAYIADNGDMEADLIPTGNGTWNLTTDNGAIALHVPTGDRYGYDALVRVDDGEPRLDIPGTEEVSRGEHHLHVRTPGYDERPVRTRLRVVSDGGGITADDNVRSYGALPVPPAVAGAGAAVGLAALLYFLWPKLKLLAAPLYTRLSRRKVLDNATRRHILRLVQEEPGVHFRELKRRTGAGRGILQHHLDKLVGAGVLSERAGAGYRCYFVGGTVDRHVMGAAESVRAESARALLNAVQAHPGATLTDLAESAGLSRSTASYHLTKLADAGLVEKGRNGGGLEVRLTELGARTVEELRLA